MDSTVNCIPSFISRWFEEVKPLALNKAVPDPTRAAIFCTDMVVGFLSRGNLASERVATLAQPVAELFRRSYQHGIRDFILLHDAHHSQTPEFKAFPVHSVEDTEESSTIPELQALPFSGIFTFIGENSLNPALGTCFNDWLDEHKYINTALVMGNSTDFCVYQLAMHLRMRANALDYQDYNVMLPLNVVNTFEITEYQAKQSGAYAHPGDFFHQVFLYHMALNGIHIVRELY